jgi:hypothetical protein
MTTLAEVLLAPARRDALVAQTARWVDDYVAALSGLRGMALRTGLAAARAARPDAVERGVARLLPEFAAALEPFWQDFRASGGRDFGEYLREHAPAASAAMMARVDARVARSSHRALATAYRRLRGTLAAELERMLPEIARRIGRTLA